MNLDEPVVAYRCGRTEPKHEHDVTHHERVTLEVFKNGPEHLAIDVVAKEFITLHLENDEATHLAVRLLGPSPLETLRRLYDVTLASSLVLHEGDTPLSDEEIEGLRRIYDQTPGTLTGMARRLIVTMLQLHERTRGR